MEQNPSEAAPITCSARVWQPHRVSRIGSPSRMTAPVAFIYHEIYDGRGFSRHRGLLASVSIGPRVARRPSACLPAALRHNQAPGPATDDDILTVHTPSLLAKIKVLDAVPAKASSTTETRPPTEASWTAHWSLSVVPTSPPA